MRTVLRPSTACLQLCHKHDISVRKRILCPRHTKIEQECHIVHGKPGRRFHLWANFLIDSSVSQTCNNEWLPYTPTLPCFVFSGWERVWKVWKPDPSQSIKRLLSVNLTKSDSLIADWKIFVRNTPSPLL